MDSVKSSLMLNNITMLTVYFIQVVVVYCTDKMFYML